MTTRPLDRDDPLDDFDRRTIRLLGTDRLVYVTGGGPAVIVMTEMPGISPHVARFARWVRDAGFTVYMPHIFGKDGAVPRMPAPEAADRDKILDYLEAAFPQRATPSRGGFRNPFAQ